ncbi:MAG: hypothetical protein JWQ69_5780 [Pseudomonas sp.]|nr:hypothetical protein [Pseudomonas sp.]
MDQIITTVAWSAPVSAILTTVLFFILRNWLLERLSGSIRNEYAKDLEEHKALLRKQTETELETYKYTLKSGADLDLEVRKATLKAQSDIELEIKKGMVQRSGHIERAQFDLELSSFKTLWSTISEMVECTALMLRMYDLTETKLGKGYKKEVALAADEARAVAHRTKQNLHPFIPKEILRFASALTELSKMEVDIALQVIKVEAMNDGSYNQKEAAKEARASLTKLLGEWDSLGNAIQQRLLQLSNTP